MVMRIVTYIQQRILQEQKLIQNLNIMSQNKNGKYHMMVQNLIRFEIYTQVQNYQIMLQVQMEICGLCILKHQKHNVLGRGSGSSSPSSLRRGIPTSGSSISLRNRSPTPITTARPWRPLRRVPPLQAQPTLMRGIHIPQMVFLTWSPAFRGSPPSVIRRRGLLFGSTIPRSSPICTSRLSLVYSKGSCR